jgi:hypothetical protein
MDRDIAEAGFPERRVVGAPRGRELGVRARLLLIFAAGSPADCGPTSVSPVGWVPAVIVKLLERMTVAEIRVPSSTESRPLPGLAAGAGSKPPLPLMPPVLEANPAGGVSST